MEIEAKNKTIHLINETRVMTLAVSDNDIPWSSPVYFVFHDDRFYFFSNENSRHITYAKDQKRISASIFHDADHMDQIFGFQMSGRLAKVSKITIYLTIVKKYVSKFSFLKQVFGPQIIENKDFFLEKFKSHLYCFHPDEIFLSDNSRGTDKRSKIELRQLV
ncbi:MAG: pyridoxamine 5'-phosphate oxidase family protein [Proteobacteria bacterium]|nr:pyridoxamine 5'-phosphate oxidase family protein [Pseudomonadota bacterium]MBU1585939.1 pyridoxamine 5'-phosphate oxidase family protein [Pseudomonadota bacterium]MBU2453896.1 pyridoxamine 5'-phosphate oxidase family protein [Pseudomonadota bacterium]MBU2628276.1 pyridoxamine 5'-phosphate oxidase family protein [Pseudomonadota bacterium]